jgi:recombinational DNA repair protein RecR
MPSGRVKAVCALPTAPEQKARRQALFREVNEHIAELTESVSEIDVNLLICECCNPACAETVEITPEDYERVRADGARFVVLPGHQLPEVERVLETSGRFLVVEKIGPAGTIARASDPRQHA